MWGWPLVGGSTVPPERTQRQRHREETQRQRERKEKHTQTVRVRQGERDTNRNRERHRKRLRHSYSIKVNQTGINKALLRVGGGEKWGERGASKYISTQLSFQQQI